MIIKGVIKIERDNNLLLKNFWINFFRVSENCWRGQTGFTYPSYFNRTGTNAYVQYFIAPKQSYPNGSITWGFYERTTKTLTPDPTECKSGMTDNFTYCFNISYILTRTLSDRRLGAESLSRAFLAVF